MFCTIAIIDKTRIFLATEKLEPAAKKFPAEFSGARCRSLYTTYLNVISRF